MPDEPLANGRLEMYTLNVGQADAHAIITEDGKLNLIDADKTEVGGKLDTILDGRTTPKTETGNIPIETFVLTHFHDDHSGGIETLYDHGYEIQHAIEPDKNRYELCDPETGKPEKGVTDATFETYIHEMKKHDPKTISQVSEGNSLSSDLDAQVVAPPDEPGTLEFTSPVTGRENTLKPTGANANSIAVKTEGDQSVLFMGDVENTGGLNGETRLMAQHDSDESEVDLSADILVIAHHGSDNATSEEFLKRVDPDMAVISSSLDNDNHHPRDSVLETLHEHDVAISWTPVHGTIGIDQEKGLSTDQANTRDTTNAADLAALKHYCRETDISPEEVETLAPGNLPEETPDWIINAAPMVAQTPEEVIDAAITNAETTEDMHQTLQGKESHPANRQLYFALRNDRNEHVTDASTVRENQHRRDKAERKQAAAQPSWRDHVQSTLPLIPDPDVPAYNGPTPDEIEGPFKEEELPAAVTDDRTAKGIRDDPFSNESPPEYLRDAEAHANTAVENAENFEALCHGLRGHPGTHTDLRETIETPETHLPENLVARSLERENTQTLSLDRSHDRDRGRGLSR
jgi:competence protein ComEC